MTLEETFAKIVGRHASDEERQRLYRLRDALGLHDNDAFWSIVVALEYYDSFFRRYPAELAEYTERCIEGARAAFAAAAACEAAQVQRTLSEKVAETSVAIALRLADRPVGLHRVTMVLAAVVAFGALCISAGYSLAAPVRPFWVTSAETLTPLQRKAAVVLAAPAGWMVFALLLPAAVYAARVGWVTASETTEGARRSSAAGSDAPARGMATAPAGRSYRRAARPARSGGSRGRRAGERSETATVCRRPTEPHDRSSTPSRAVMTARRTILARIVYCVHNALGT